MSSLPVYWQPDGITKSDLYYSDLTSVKLPQSRLLTVNSVKRCILAHSMNLMDFLIKLAIQSLRGLMKIYKDSGHFTGADPLATSTGSQLLAATRVWQLSHFKVTHKLHWTELCWTEGCSFRLTKKNLIDIESAHTLVKIWANRQPHGGWLWGFGIYTICSYKNC